MVHVPFSLGAIGVFHSVPVAEAGSDGVKLSACVLAKIFSGQITTWDHEDIKAENSQLAVPANTKILVGRRSLGSSSTGGLTGYLESKCSANWTMVGSGAPMGSGSKITWPSLSNFQMVEGSPGMKALIADTPYAIGYLDAGHGHQRGFSEVKLQNEANTWLTSAEAIAAVENGINGIAAAGKAAVDASPTQIPTDATADWSGVNLYGKDGPNTWPIVLVSYIYLNKDWTMLSPGKAGILKAFVDFVTGAQGQAMLADYSFNSIPDAMNQWPNTWGSVIQKPSLVTDFGFETSTNAWNGQQLDMISSKRNSYSMWKLSEMDVAVKSMVNRLDSVETSMNDYGIVPLHGSGTTNPKNMFAKAMKLMEHRARVPLLLTYRAVGSSTGQKEFVGQAANSYKSYNHFGAGDIPMSQTNYDLLMGRSPAETMVHLPFALGAIGIFHNVPTAELGEGDLKLNACTLAKIFSGLIVTWDDESIKAQNPGMSVPSGTKIQVGHRTLGSSSTGGLAGYLSKKCSSSEWTLGTGSKLQWPDDKDNFKAVQGSPGMQTHIKDTAYSIGYLDAGHGHDFGFSEVALTNLAGQTRTSKQSIALGGVADAGAQGVTSNVFPADASADWSAVNLYDLPGDNTWPIVLVSYMYVKKSQVSTNPKTAAALQAFIKMIIENQEGLCEEFGFTAPSDTLRTLALNAAKTIAYPSGMTEFTFETGTQAYTGMGTEVISKKRHAFDDYERSVMKSEIASMKATGFGASPPVDGDDDSYALSGNSDDDMDIVPVAISAVALALSLVACCLGFLATKGGGNSNKEKLADGDPQPSAIGAGSAL